LYYERNKNVRITCISEVKNLTIGKEYLTTHDIKNQVFWLIDDYGYRESYLPEFFEINTETYFFDQDDSGYWFMIPSDKREKWIEVKTLDLDEENDNYKIWLESHMEDYMIGGGISNINFAPINI
jgi:hypothetical protein